MGSVGRTFWVEDTDIVDELDLVQCQRGRWPWLEIPYQCRRVPYS